MGKKESHNSIQKYILTKIPIAKKTDTVKSILLMLEKESNTYDNVDYIYVTDSKGNLIGVLSIRDVFNNPKNMPIEKIMKKNLITASPKTEMEKIAHLALKHDLRAIPIVKSKKLIGIISSRKIISILNKSLREDIFHFAGIHKSHLDFENSMEITLFKAIKDRLPWLIIGLFGAMLIATYIGFFENMLAKYLILGAFVPAIVYMADALGTQVQTIFVRDIAILGKGLDFKAYFFKQMAVTLAIASLMGILMFSIISIFWKAPFIAFAISFAAFISLLVTSVTALLITLLIKRFRFDPALGSGPIATIISDMTSIVIYFVIVFLLL